MLREERAMGLRFFIIAGVFVFLSAIVNLHSSENQGELPTSSVPSGQVTYKQFCASCHGEDAKGRGPIASSLKTPPSDLTMLAKRRMGRFPYEYVSNILRFGPDLIGGGPNHPPYAHGSSEMPTWGPIFRVTEKNDEGAVEQRIKNLCEYLASVQEK